MMSISRNSVIAGFERLIDEGYLFTRRGAGTFVANTIPDVIISDKWNKIPYPPFSPQPQSPLDTLNPNMQKHTLFGNNHNPLSIAVLSFMLVLDVWIFSLMNCGVDY